jgi:hypothetical protein
MLREYDMMGTSSRIIGLGAMYLYLCSMHGSVVCFA